MLRYIGRAYRKPSLPTKEGLWEVRVPTGLQDLQIDYLGYVSIHKGLDIRGEGFLDIKLRPEAMELATVVVTANATDENITSTQAGLSSISVRKIGGTARFTRRSGCGSQCVDQRRRFIYREKAVSVSMCAVVRWIRI
ncbi:MAG: hypothetical protein R2795_09200 [Saprospiraceae bacterium]